jgi:hypothetical protein
VVYSVFASLHAEYYSFTIEECVDDDGLNLNISENGNSEARNGGHGGKKPRPDKHEDGPKDKTRG